MKLSKYLKKCKMCGKWMAIEDKGETCSSHCRARLARVWKMLPDRLRPVLSGRKPKPRPPAAPALAYKVRNEFLDTYPGPKDRCAICGDRQGKRRLHLDHDHATGVLRGLLCHGCNVGLGLMRDRVDILEHAITYLKRSRQA